MNITELCVFIKNSGAEIAILPRPLIGGVKFVLRKYRVGEKDELLIDTHEVTSERMDETEYHLGMLIERFTAHEHEILRNQNSKK